VTNTAGTNAVIQADTNKNVDISAGTTGTDATINFFHNSLYPTTGANTSFAYVMLDNSAASAARTASLTFAGPSNTTANTKGPVWGTITSANILNTFIGSVGSTLFLYAGTASYTSIVNFTSPGNLTTINAGNTGFGYISICHGHNTFPGFITFNGPALAQGDNAGRLGWITCADTGNLSISGKTITICPAYSVPVATFSSTGLTMPYNSLAGGYNSNVITFTNPNGTYGYNLCNDGYALKICTTAAAANTAPTPVATFSSTGSLTFGSAPNELYVNIPVGVSSNNGISFKIPGDSRTRGMAVVYNGPGSDNNIDGRFQISNGASNPSRTTFYAYLDLTTMNAGFSYGSDIRLKKKVTTNTDNKLNTICNLRVVNYNYISDSENSPSNLGFIAQEVKEIIPEAISLGDDDMLNIHITVFIPYLVKAVQELSTQVTSQESTINALQTQVTTLMQQMETLLAKN